jgi:hypothetical protein
MTDLEDLLDPLYDCIVKARAAIDAVTLSFPQCPVRSQELTHIALDYLDKACKEHSALLDVKEQSDE